MVSEWLEWRAGGIGASDIAGILGVSPWNSRYSIWLSKVYDPSAGELANAEAMKWGKLLEDSIIAEAARRLGVTAYGLQTRCEHPSLPWARCTVDAFCVDEQEREGVIEAKNTGEAYWHDLPDYYEAQVLWQLEVTGRSYGWVAALHNGRKLSLWRVDADPDLQRGLIDTARYFWERHVITGQAPAIDGAEATTDALGTLYSQVDAGAIAELDNDDEALTALDVLPRLARDIKTLERDKARLENIVKSALGRNEVGTIGGVPAVTWKASRSRRVDLDKLRSDFPHEAAECEYVLESRRLILKRTSETRTQQLAS